ncbi:hace1 [Symbiodinium sp. CCMP2592]|nr:hace1 [Symbiodinium sp. CCMP2592]
MYIFGTGGRRADPPRSKGDLSGLNSAKSQSWTSEGGNKISLAQSLGSSSNSSQRKQSYESPVTTVGEVTPARSWTSSHYETSPHAGLGTRTFFGTAPPPRQEGPPLLFTSPTPPPLVPLAPPAATMMMSPPVFSGPPCAAPSLPPNISMCSFQAPPPPPAAAPKMAPQPYTFHTDLAASSLQSTAANAQGDLDDQSSQSTVTKEAPSPEEKEEVSRFDSKSSRRRWADIVNDSDDDDPWNVNTSVGATPSSCSSPVPSSQEPSSAQPTCTTSADTAALGCPEPATEDNTESTEEVLEPLHEELHETSLAPKLEPAASEGKRAKPSCEDQITSIKDCATDFPCLDIDCSQDSVALSTVADSIDCMSSIADCPEVDITESLPDVGEAAGLGGLGSAVKKRKKKSARKKKTEVVDLSRTSSVVSEVTSRRSSRSAPSETSSTTSATGKRSASKSQSSKRPDTSQQQGAFPSARHASQFQAGLASCASAICDNPRWAILMLLAAVVFGGKCWLRIHGVELLTPDTHRTMFVKEGKGITSVQMEQLARLAAGEDLAARGTGTTGCRSGCLLM